MIAQDHIIILLKSLTFPNKCNVCGNYKLGCVNLNFDSIEILENKLDI